MNHIDSARGILKPKPESIRPHRLALKVLHEIAEKGQYEFIFWFSARDIDLLPAGPKVVKPRVLTEKDIADEFFKLVAAENETYAELSHVEILQEAMRANLLGGNAIFVFDNFETVRSPLDLFNWIDMNTRLPNKVLITSRFREFRADFPIEVGGMERPEADRLIDQTAIKLGVEELLTSDHREAILEESGGHPYVIKIIIGEMADSQKRQKPERIIARKEEILDALFERTYANLLPAAKRVFLTLSSWRSYIPELALEAVLLRPVNDRMDVSLAVDELVRMSLVERVSGGDSIDYLSVPLAAQIFGERKLSAHPNKSSIESDVRILQELGPTNESRLREGIGPKVRSLFQRIANRVSEGREELSEVQPVLEFIARNYPPAWMLMAELHEEDGGRSELEAAAECIRRFLETQPDPADARNAWEHLADDYVRLNDIAGASDALVRSIEFPDVPFSSISNAALWINNHRGQLSDQERSEREQLFQRVVQIMERRMNEATPTDLSRLAWLYLPGDTKRALELAESGLQQEPDNVHCLKLVERLSLSA